MELTAEAPGGDWRGRFLVPVYRARAGERLLASGASVCNFGHQIAAHPRPASVSSPLEALFLEQLPTIRRIAGAVARRNGLRGDEVEDWISTLLLRFVEQDYEMLGKFRGESTIATYLTVVVAMLFRDYRVQRWGRWRPSAAALRQGVLAVRLETLVHRDGMPLAEAAERLRTSGETTSSDAELARLLGTLPVRGPLRPREVAIEPVADHLGDLVPRDRLDVLDAEERTTRAERASAEALAELPAEDQVIVRLRYWEGLSVADVARALGVEQKPLYRRIERSLGHLRRRLEARGITRDEARAVLEDAGL